MNLTDLIYELLLSVRMTRCPLEISLHERHFDVQVEGVEAHAAGRVVSFSKINGITDRETRTTMSTASRQHDSRFRDVFLPEARDLPEKYDGKIPAMMLDDAMTVGRYRYWKQMQKEVVIFTNNTNIKWAHQRHCRLTERN